MLDHEPAIAGLDVADPALSRLLAVTDLREPETVLAANAEGGTQLRRRWVPDGSPRAAVLIVHGIAEHSGRYLHVGSALAEAGFDVLAFDNRGFGQSGGKRAHVGSFDEFARDIRALLAERRSLGVPVVLLGHSLGGLMATGYLVRGEDLPDLAILSAPAVEAVIPAWQRILAPILARIAPSQFVPGKHDPSLLTRDVAVQDAFTDDPLRVTGATAGFGQAAFAEMELALGGLDRIDLPTYVVHGGEDELVPTASSERFEELAGVTRRVWPGLRHESFNEPEGPEVLAELIAWIDARLADLGAASPERPASA